LNKKIGLLSKFKRVFTRRPAKKEPEFSDQAVSELEELIKANPGNFRLRLKLADIYQLRGEKEKAQEAYLTNARLYLENDFIPLAIATYKKILNDDPNHLDANLEISQIYRKKKFFADATAHLRRVFDYYLENQLTGQALETLETLISIAPDKEPFRQLQRELFPEHQEKERSIYSDIIVTGKSQSAQSDDSELAELAEMSGDFFDLGQELGAEIIIPEEPSANVTRIEDSDLDLDEHGIEKIFQTMKSTFEEEKKDTDADKFHYNMVLAYYELNMLEQALKESEILLKSDNFRLPTLLLRSRILLDQGSLNAALSQAQQGLLEKGLTRHDFITLKTQLGMILKEMGHLTRALEALKEAYDLEPGNQELSQEIAQLEQLAASASNQ